MPASEQQIRDLAAECCTGKDIAARLGMPVHDVVSAMRVLGIKPSAPTASQIKEEARRKAVQERKEARKAAGEARRKAAQERRDYVATHGKRLYRRPNYFAAPKQSGRQAVVNVVPTSAALLAANPFCIGSGHGKNFAPAPIGKSIG